MISIYSAFSVHDTTVTADGVLFAGGPINLQESTWIIGDDDLTANDDANFQALAFNGSSFTVAGDFNFNGSSGNLLDLVATEAWYLTVAGSGSASYVDVAFSDASEGSTIYAANYTSIDGGDNYNWIFQTPTELGGTIITSQKFGGTIETKNRFSGSITSTNKFGGEIETTGRFGGEIETSPRYGGTIE